MIKKKDWEGTEAHFFCAAVFVREETVMMLA